MFSVYPLTGFSKLESLFSCSKLNLKSKISRFRSSAALTDEERPSHSAEERDGALESTQSASVPFPPIKAAKRVVLVRHGQSTWNEEGRIQGSSDYSVLTSKGEAQAETSRQMLLDDSFDVCFASPLKRARQTAEIIWGHCREATIMEYDLREIDLYSFQGLLKHEGKERFGDAYHQWQVDAPNFNIDGHYPVRELWERARSCWNRILVHESQSVLVVAHNAVNQALIATSLGLGTEYFRILIQSNCGVSVLDFIPQAGGVSPYICLNRLNQTPNSPIAAGSFGGRKASQRIILVCHGSLQNNAEVGDMPMNILGVIQSQKTAELLLDLKVNTIVTSPKRASLETAVFISRVQEAADCLGADCAPRNVNMKKMKELDVGNIFRQSKRGNVHGARDRNQDGIVDPIARCDGLEGFEDGVIGLMWDQAGKAWQFILDELCGEPQGRKNVVVVGNPTVHVALITRCLNLEKDRMGSFHMDEGSINVIDFPDGPTGRGVIRCLNYTAHLGRWSIPITKSTLKL
ncbi:hypothetical protein Nepgr_000312 [Nepenthes gracilis]|uniref:2-carboxy-D-arabinitol-1-phosphatase n=1 Tax=Nepenthes gracilis TaxID=150966 RepID=A0AAD3RWQ8_NEPGR|nr:hypothetical protein Nepgr_000312 [Nepenthes gracilis]